MQKTIDIHEAEFENIESCATIALLGKRRSGKTTFAKFFLQSLKGRLHRFIAICGNKENASEWQEVIPELFIHGKNMEYLQKIRDYQDTKIAQFRKEQKEIPDKYKLCIIFDDCGSDRSFMFHNLMKDLLSNGRHYGMTIILLCQYLNQMHAENRDQLDYLGILHTSNTKNLKKIYTEYVSLGDFKDFLYIVKACTSQKGMCWIDNTNVPHKLNDAIFYKNIDMSVPIETIVSPDVKRYADRHILIEKESDTKNTYSSSEDEDTDPELKSLMKSKFEFSDKKGKIFIVKTKRKQKVD